MALAENHMVSLVLAKTRRKAPFLAAPYQGILVSRDPGGPHTIHDNDDGVRGSPACLLYRDGP